MNPQDREVFAEIRDQFNRLIELPANERAHELGLLREQRAEIGAKVLELLRANDAAPSFLERPMAPSRLLKSFAKSQPPIPQYSPGDRIDDFLILRELGRGAFATVYSAIQISLGREIALKISRNWGSEAKTMAVLDHDHIVRVFSESVHVEQNLRIICMQLVEGTTLEDVLLHNVGSHFTKGIEDVLRMGINLARALDYAHSRDVLHLDVKPGNILLNRHQKPLLTDFNVALHGSASETGKTQLLGGTLRYMPPEQLRLMERGENATDNAISLDQRADIYALGIVLKESFEKLGINVPDRVRRTLDKATRENPADRYTSAEEMAKALDAACEHEGVTQALPKTGKILEATARYPFFSILTFILLPQVVASIVQIVYNALLIVSRLTPEQQKLFEQLVLIFNPIVYTPCAIYLHLKISPIRLFLRNPKHFLETHSEQEVAALRAHTLKIPWTIAWVAALGWTCGFFFFPTAIRLMTGPLPLQVYLLFFMSFVLAGALAVSYSALYGEFICLRGIYPRLFVETMPIREKAREEIDSTAGRLGVQQYLVGFTPLLGALFILIFGGRHENPQTERVIDTFLAFLVVMGITGFVLGVRVTRIVERTRSALTGVRTAAA